MARRKPPEDSGGGGSWMDTYGDMVTLLLAFFVLLFSFSEVNAKKWEELVASFTGARMTVIQPLDPGAVPGGMDIIRAPSPTQKPGVDAQQGWSLVQEEVEGQFGDLYQSMQAYIGENRLESSIVLERQGAKIVMRIKDSALFDSGRAEIKDSALDLLQNIVTIMDVYQDAIEWIRVEGHTDNRPIDTTFFPSNWELGAFRAINVIHFFEDYSTIPRNKLVPISYSEYHPVDTNDTDEGRQKNRRVEFLVEQRQIENGSSGSDKE
jgi:chemotaxis protein MotB